MNNRDTLAAFFAAWNRMDWDAVAGLMTEDVIYQAIPWTTVYGRKDVMEYMDGFNIQDVDWQIVNMVVEGDMAMAERVDRVNLSGEWKSLRMVGVFKFREDGICEWRDYFDPAELSMVPPRPEWAFHDDEDTAAP